MFSGNVLKRWAPAFGLIVLLGVNAVFLHCNAFRVFNYYDMSFNMDGGWRVLNGQRPYVDFIHYSGAVHLYMMAFFFKLFGFGKTAIFTHLITVQSAVMIMVYMLTRRQLPPLITLGLTALTMTSFYWPIGHPWHDHSAHLWGLAGVIILYRGLIAADNPRAGITGLLCGFLAAVAFFTKPSIGAGYGLFFAVMIGMSPSRIRAWAGFAGGALAAVAGLSLIASPWTYWLQARDYDQQIADHRFPRLLVFRNWLWHGYWLAMVLLWALALLGKVRHKRVLTFFTGFYVLTVYLICTGAIMRDVYVFLHGFFMALAFLAFYAMADRVRAMRPVLCYHGTKTLLIMMMLGLTVITVRDSVNLKIWSYIGSDPAGTYAVKTDGLSGWMSDPVRGEALDNMAAFINSSVPAGDRILVLSDMQILYALTGRPSYPHIPLIQLQENHAPPPGRQQEKVTDYIHEHKPDWLVVDILSYLRVIPYMGLSEMINQEYTIVSTSGPYAILQHLN